MYKKYEMDLGGRTFSAELGAMAEFANGAVYIKYGDTTVLVAVTSSEKPREGIDFFPLSIDYEERFYAVGKIPGGFIKREGRPTEKAVLAGRLTDRPIRPLFPEDYRNEVSVVATVMSVDQDSAPEIAAMIGASIALGVSDIPFDGPIGSSNVGLVDGEFILNPNQAQRDKSSLNLIVSSTGEKIMMIEAGADQVPEDVVYKAILFAHEENKKIVAFIENIVRELGKEKHNYVRNVLPESVCNIVKEAISEQTLKEAIYTEDKSRRQWEMSKLRESAMAAAASLEYTSEELGNFVDMAIYKMEKSLVRELILKENLRPDKRQLTDLRKLTAQVDIIPRVHGSALFSRGQTQVLAVTTLASIGEAQILDGLDLAEESKRYMHHYNFPSYSVGETRPSRGPGRREIGHGALAEKALLPVLPTEEDFPYAIRVVSEVIASNGSTSQGSVCAGTLSLMAAGVPISDPVAGISVGLVTEGDDFALLTDIQGMEDFFGDMDFKVAGTKKGITAIQLDMKINGITEEIIKQSLEDTKRSRNIILDDIMLKCIPEPRKEISPFAPKIGLITIDIEKMADVIGPRGKVIKRIIEESGVDKIDTEDDGRIFVAHSNQANVDHAISIIKAIITVPEPGDVFNGRVTRIMNFGAFVEIAPEKEGLVHISQISKARIAKVEDVLKVGDQIKVKVLEIDDQGRINLSRKALLK